MALNACEDARHTKVLYCHAPRSPSADSSILALLYAMRFALQRPFPVLPSIMLLASWSLAVRSTLDA